VADVDGEHHEEKHAVREADGAANTLSEHSQCYRPTTSWRLPPDHPRRT
jgi:hypothetical protein